ncbi:MAG: glycosyltransferase family 1 protein [Candidatus Omnitrophota bacterium]
MRIAISLISSVDYGGVTYARNLILALAENDKLNKYYIYAANPELFQEIPQQDNFFFKKCKINHKSLLVRFLWEQFILPYHLSRIKADLLFTAKNITVFFAPCKAVIAIQNMEPFFFTRYDNDWKLNIRSYLKKFFSEMSLRRAEGVISVSAFSRRSIEKVYPGVKDKITVIYNGNPLQGVSISDDSEPGQKPYFLSSSKFVAYANQLNLVNGYVLLNRKVKDLPPLWLVGGKFDNKYFNKINNFVKENGLEQKIIILGFLPYERLIKLYRKSSLFLFPSTLEACPQTLIEAMSCGASIVASCSEPMPEICVDAAVYFDPYSPEDICDKIEEVYLNTGLREKLSKLALERSRFFDWNRIAVETIDFFHRIAVDKKTQGVA